MTLCSISMGIHKKKMAILVQYLHQAHLLFPLSFCYETIVDHQTKYGILKKNTFSSYSDKNCMFKMGRRLPFCNG